MANKVLQYAVIGFLIFTILQASFLLYQLEKYTLSVDEDFKSTAAASGVVELCLNSPPRVNLTACNSTTNQNSFFSCQVTADDSDTGSLHVFSSSFITNNTIFNITSAGLISYTSDSGDVGNHSANISAVDNSNCSNSLNWTLYNFTVVNVNDPPFLAVNLTNVSFGTNETIRPFFLNNHFSDLDGDALTYNVSGADEANITIESDSEVIITSETCDFDDLVIFTAQDPFSLTAESNEIIISCTSTSVGSGSSSSTGTSSGAGGGGGGGGSTVICRPDFYCFDLEECTTNNTKTKKCADVNGCKDEEYLTIQCNYEQEKKSRCTEDWLCGGWGLCLINDTQSRKCIDQNQCDTIFDRPDLTQPCKYIPTCSDGVRNGDEIGIDCGGSCPVCLTIETPAAIQQERNWLTTILTVLILTVLLSVLAYKYAHREIYMLLAKLGLHFAGRVEKQILLDEKNRDSLLQELTLIESHYASEGIKDLTKDYIELAKSYFFRTLSLEIDSDKEDLLAMCEERKLNEHLVRVLASFFDKMLNIEFSTEKLGGYELMYLVEELRELVLQTCEYTDELLDATVTAYRIPDNLYPLEKIRLQLVNAYKALHFNELQVAAQDYMQLLDAYEKLSEQEEDMTYTDIGRLFQKIRYRAAWIRNME